MKINYKLPLVIMPVALVAIVVVLGLWPKPKYVYAVRERVVTEQKFVSWDLWCWHEYANGRIDKKYIGHFQINGTSELGVNSETSLCPKKGVL